jgi:hypothetical protein
LKRDFSHEKAQKTQKSLRGGKAPDELFSYRLFLNQLQQKPTYPFLFSSDQRLHDTFTGSVQFRREHSGFGGDLRMNSDLFTKTEGVSI